jgi:protein gp37
MGQNTAIEWCKNTFNPWWGCEHASPGCDNCYAEADAKRYGFANIWGRGSSRKFMSEAYWKKPLKWSREAQMAGERQRTFCGSMCDVMDDHPDVGPHRECLYRLIEATPYLDWLLLTKRPQNFRRFLPRDWLRSPLPNVWLMTSIESPAYLWRADILSATPAALRGLSIEPLLDPIPDLSEHLSRIDWVILGGESGAKARSCHISWIRDLLRQCRESNVAPFIKQVGRRPDGLIQLLRDKKGGNPDEWPQDLRVRESPR